MPNFEEFDRMNARVSRRVGESVTVQRRGNVGFSVEAMAALGNPRAVVYLVDRDERLLGFRPATPGTANASAVRGSGRIASAVAVLKDLGADLSQSRRYPLAESDGIRCIDLKQPGTIVTSNRRKS
jgi:hypothetical protein